MVAGVVLAAVVALLVPKQWKATQGLLIRPEAAGLANDRLGKFDDLSQMKTIQETLLELARSKKVVTTALESVGRRQTWFASDAPPTAEEVESFRDAMVMTPPGGAEFGKTEVFYLGVKDTDSQRAAALVTALSESLETRTQQIREHQATSMIDELRKGAEGAEAVLDRKISQLSSFEEEVGADLSDMRSLVNPLGGSNATSQDILAIRSELRQNDASRQQNQKLLEVLKKSQDNPHQFIATPSTLLTSQPALARLKQGLVEAQLRSARLLGQFSDKHPLVLAARESESQVRKELYRELAIANEGVQIELALSQGHQKRLQENLAKKQSSQRNLATHRAAYSRLVASVDNQTQLVDAARSRLADAQVHQAGAQSASLLTRIDEVESGLRPVGPSRSSIVAAGGMLGGIIGLGLVFFLHGPAPVGGEKKNDQASEVYSHPPTCEPFGFPTTQPLVEEKMPYAAYRQ